MIEEKKEETEIKDESQNATPLTKKQDNSAENDKDEEPGKKKKKKKGKKSKKGKGGVPIAIDSTTTTPAAPSNFMSLAASAFVPSQMGNAGATG